MKIFKLENPQDQAILNTPTPHLPTDFTALTAYIPFINSLVEKHKEMGGVGLAAKQVGASLPIIVVEITPLQAQLRECADAFPLQVFINPDYVGIGENTDEDIEGCFSVDHIAGWVPRFQKILFTAIQYDFNTQEFNVIDKKTYMGFIARVIQHETDHIHGLLITDRLKKESLQGPVTEMYAIRRAKLSPEKRELLDKLMTKQKLQK